MPPKKEVHWWGAAPGICEFPGCSDLAYGWEKLVPASRRRHTGKEMQVLVDVRCWVAHGSGVTEVIQAGHQQCFRYRCETLSEHCLHAED